MPLALAVELSRLDAAERSALVELAEALFEAGQDSAYILVRDGGGGQTEPCEYRGRVSLAALRA